jgi:hexokinase
MASSYVDKETQIGSIFGTGSNAAYMERCSEIPKLAKHCLPHGACMAINCEYGAFDNSGTVLPFTDYDEIIDSRSPRPGQQRYDKLVAGFYLGEIFRQVLVDMSNKRRMIFRSQDISRLKEPYTLDASFLAAIESDGSDDLHVSKALFQSVLSISASSDELYFCRLLAELIGQRAARLYACGVAAIIKKRSLGKCHVAVDGSVFNKYRGFHERVMDALGELLEWPCNLHSDTVRLIPAVDGSSVGAAVICALTSSSLGKSPE